ncbi:MAG: hypothetical protein ACFFEF_19825 [Candidatus Thorarchaeota archaeon]
MNKRVKLVTTLVTLVVLLGVSTCGVAAVSPPDEIGTISGTIADLEYLEIGTLDFDAGKEVYMQLVVEDIYPELDLDLELYGPDGELIWLGGWGHDYGDSPDIIEEGFFWIPQSGTHTIYLYGYWVPDEYGDPGSCDYTLYYEVGDNLIDPTVVESSGARYGEIKSYISSSPTAKMMASDKAAFGSLRNSLLSVPDMYDKVFINAYTTNWAQSWTPYALPGLVLCADDPLIVGGVDWTLPADWFANYKEANQYMGHYDIKIFIEDMGTGTVTALSDLTNTKTGSVKTVHLASESIAYTKILEYGVFMPGELAELIGTGQKLAWCYLTYDDEVLGLSYMFSFWVLHEGELGPG